MFKQEADFEDEFDDFDYDENQPLIKKVKSNYDKSSSDKSSEDHEEEVTIEDEDDEDEPDKEIKDAKEEPKVEERVEIEENVQIPNLILEEVQDEVLENAENENLETVIEEPVIEEDDNSISEPPLRSCSVDTPEAEIVSIPSPLVQQVGVATNSGGEATPSPTPQVLSGTPIPQAGLPTEPLPITADTAIPSVSSTIVASSPASIRSARGNSITFSSSRSPSPTASMASSQEDVTDSEVSSKETMPELKIPLSEVDMSLLQTKGLSAIKTTKTRTHPTAAINKYRTPQGDVNLERSIEIVRSAVEKSVKSNTTSGSGAVGAGPSTAVTSGEQIVLAGNSNIHQVQTIQQPQQVVATKPHPPPPQQQQPTPTVIKAQPPQVSNAPTMLIPMRAPTPQVQTGAVVNAAQVQRPPLTNAVLVTTSDGKTILAHPASQILRGAAGQPVRVRLPAGKTVLAGNSNMQPQVRQVRLIQPGSQRPTTVFRMPVSSTGASLDASQLTSLVVSRSFFI